MELFVFTTPCVGTASVTSGSAPGTGENHSKPLKGPQLDLHRHPKIIMMMPEVAYTQPNNLKPRSGITGTGLVGYNVQALRYPRSILVGEW